MVDMPEYLYLKPNCHIEKGPGNLKVIPAILKFNKEIESVEEFEDICTYYRIHGAGINLNDYNLRIDNVMRDLSKTKMALITNYSNSNNFVFGGRSFNKNQRDKVYLYNVVGIGMDNPNLEKINKKRKERSDNLKETIKTSKYLKQVTNDSIVLDENKLYELIVEEQKDNKIISDILKKRYKIVLSIR
ncbi:MAG: hypothetical protein ACI4V7_07505 [Succinivibrionaceae bacterium]